MSGDDRIENRAEEQDEADEALAHLLRSAERPIADDGFTDRVMVRLPRAPRRSRRAVLLAAFAVAAGIALVLLVPRLTAVMTRGLASAAPLSAMLAAAAVALMVIGSGIVAARPE